MSTTFVMDAGIVMLAEGERANDAGVGPCNRPEGAGALGKIGACSDACKCGAIGATGGGCDRQGVYSCFCCTTASHEDGLYKDGEYTPVEGM